MSRRGVDILSALVDRATDTGGGLRTRMGGLAACVAVAFVVFVAAKAFMLVGVWVLVALGWLAIGVFAWRFRGNIDLSRLREAVRNDRLQGGVPPEESP